MTRRVRAAIGYVLLIVACLAVLLAAGLHGIDARCHRAPGYPGCTSPPPTERTSP